MIGTNAWIDGFGYLRQNDYIADIGGYRILKAKTFFVGKDRPIEVSLNCFEFLFMFAILNLQEAMKMAKNSPPTSGVLVPNNQPTSYIPPVTTTTRPIVTTTYVTPGYYYQRAPATVVIRPHSHPRDKYLPPSKNFADLEQPRISIPSNDISSIQVPSVYYELPLEASPKTLLTPIVVLPSSTPAPDESDLVPIAYHPSSTPKPLHDESHLPPIAYYPSSTVKPLVKQESHLPHLAHYPSSTQKPPTVKDESHLPPIAYYPSSTENPFDSNSVIPLSSTLAPIVVSPLSNDLQPPKGGFNDVVSITSRPRTNYRQPSGRHEATRNVVVDYDRNSIDEVGRSYDGVGVTRNGFRYFLPRQYQEEVTNNDESRDGSFGYVDPFGIRRVVYYNAGKNGFVHRKNNRYVGFNSTPYDPRPN